MLVNLAFAGWTSSVTHLIHLLYVAYSFQQGIKGEKGDIGPPGQNITLVTISLHILYCIFTHFSNLIFNLCDWLDCCCLQRFWHVRKMFHFTWLHISLIIHHDTVQCYAHVWVNWEGRTYIHTGTHLLSVSKKCNILYEKWFIQKKRGFVKEKTSRVNMNVIWKEDMSVKRSEYIKGETWYI